jgi:hypothetical protein
MEGGSVDIHNRLTALGSQRALKSFEKSDLFSSLLGKYPELYYADKTRHTWWFPSARVERRELMVISVQWPQLVLLLEFDNETRREMGIIKAVQGRVEQCQFTY